MALKNETAARWHGSAVIDRVCDPGTQTDDSADDASVNSSGPRTDDSPDGTLHMFSGLASHFAEIVGLGERYVRDRFALAPDEDLDADHREDLRAFVRSVERHVRHVGASARSQCTERDWRYMYDRGWDAGLDKGYEIAVAELKTKPNPLALVLPEGDDLESQVQRVLALVDYTITEMRGELFHSPRGDAYATVPTTTRLATMAIDSRPFRDWLDYLFYSSTKGAMSDSARQASVNVLRARAKYDGPERPVFVRVGEHEGHTYLDLADEQGRVVEIDGNGWRVVDTSPVRFVQRPGMLALPQPVRDANVTIDRLWHYVHVREEDRLRYLAFLVGALNPTGPYYHLVLTGQSGSVKTSSARYTRQLVDPNEAPTRNSINEDRDVMISAEASWFQVYDNLKPLTADQSNAMCCLSTGAGFATRALFTNADEQILKAKRPAILVGIADIVTAGDLLQRSIRIDCPKLPKDKRLTEADVNATFERDRPGLLAALLDLVSTAIRNLPAVAERTDIAWPRMADAARFAVAALGEDVLGALESGADVDHEITLDASPIGRYVLKLAQTTNYSGTASEILARLTSMAVPQGLPRDWPKDATRLSGMLREIAPALASHDVAITVPDAKARPRVWTLARAESASERRG